MSRKLVRVCAALTALASMQAFAEDLVMYVNHCKTQLGFTTLPAMNCFNGQRFAFPNQGIPPSRIGWSMRASTRAST